MNLNSEELAILNGTVLPKGHGRLIDADALEIKNLASSVSHTNIWGVAPLDIDIAPTIIEADNAESNDKEGSK